MTEEEFYATETGIFFMLPREFSKIRIFIKDVCAKGHCTEEAEDFFQRLDADAI